MWCCSGPSQVFPLPFLPPPDTELLPCVLSSLFLCVCPLRAILQHVEVLSRGKGLGNTAPVRCFLSWLAAWGLVCVLLFLHRWSALVGWLSFLECAFWGFLPLFALLHVFHLFRLFVTHTGIPPLVFVR